MRTIRCIRGGQHFAATLPNGDKYDSIMTVTDGTTCHMVNTDPSHNYKSYGILEEGTYKYICGIREGHPDKPKVLFLYHADLVRELQIKKSSDLTEDDMTLPSLIPNPNHNNKKIMTFIQVHRGGTISDWSQGCITVEPKLWDDFINQFELGEKGLFELERDPLFVPDDRYKC